MNVVLAGSGALLERVRLVLAEANENVSVAHSPPELRRCLELAEPTWLISAGYRYIIPSSVLEAFPLNCNIHPSLLPWGRGANPNVWVIVKDEPAGVTIHQMTQEVDKGPVFAQKQVDALFCDTAKDLYERLIDEAASLFKTVWPALRTGRLQPSPQPVGGSYHSIEEFRRLTNIDTDTAITWKSAINILRALTFPPYHNFVIQENGKRYHVEIRLEELSE